MVKILPAKVKLFKPAVMAVNDMEQASELACGQVGTARTSTVKAEGLTDALINWANGESYDDKWAKYIQNAEKLNPEKKLGTTESDELPNPVNVYMALAAVDEDSDAARKLLLLRAKMLAAEAHAMDTISRKYFGPYIKNVASLKTLPAQLHKKGFSGMEHAMQEMIKALS